MTTSRLGVPLHIVKNFDEIVSLFEKFGLTSKNVIMAGEAYVENIKVVDYRDLPKERTVTPLWTKMSNEGFLFALHPDGTIQARRAEPFSPEEEDRLDSLGLEVIGGR
jgi:hypothetical protein